MINISFNENDLDFNLSTDKSKSTESSINKYPSIISPLIYLLRETKQYDFFKSKKDLIKNKFDRNKKKNKDFYYVLDSFEYLNTKQKIYFKQSINNIQKLLDKINLDSINLENNSSKNSYLSNSSRMSVRSQFFSSLEDVITDFFKIIYNYSRNLITKEMKIDVIHSIQLKVENSEEEAVKDFEEEMSKKPKGINDFYNLFFFKLFPIEEVKEGKYKIKRRYFLTFEIKKIIEFMNQKIENKNKEITLKDCFAYYNEIEGKIYESPEIMIIYFIIESPEHKINYNDNKEFEINLIKGRSVNYKLSGIIYEEKDEYFTIISENLEGKKWKKYNSEEQIVIDNENKLDYCLPKPTILIYKRIEN